MAGYKLYITPFKPDANESPKTRNKKQNGLAHSRFIFFVTSKPKKILLDSRIMLRTCAKQPINNISEVTWLCTWFPKCGDAD